MEKKKTFPNRRVILYIFHSILSEYISFGLLKTGIYERKTVERANNILGLLQRYFWPHQPLWGFQDLTLWTAALMDTEKFRVPSYLATCINHSDFRFKMVIVQLIGWALLWNTVVANCSEQWYILAFFFLRTIIEWSESHDRGYGKFQTAKMEDFTFNDLYIKVGFPYLYCHQGDCEHVVVITDIR